MNRQVIDWFWALLITTIIYWLTIYCNHAFPFIPSFVIGVGAGLLIYFYQTFYTPN